MNKFTPGPWTLPVGVIGPDKVWDAEGNREIYAGWYPGCPKTREEFQAEYEAQRAQAA